MKPDKNQLSDRRQRHAEHLERANPMVRVVHLVNYYHSIDLMSATAAEKSWAKDRLVEEIKGAWKGISPSTRGLIRSCLKNKDLWEETRDRLL